MKTRCIKRTTRQCLTHTHTKLTMPDKKKDLSKPKHPPFDGLEGTWLKRKQFIQHGGKKSFGLFVCKKCENGRWISAHAYAIFRQGCQVCETYSLPLYMWLNDEKCTQTRKTKKEDKPHHDERCQACKAGICLAGPKHYRR